MTFTPTATKDGTPTCCHVCGTRAEGAGIGNPLKGDPRFLCTECLLIIKQIKETRRFDPYEQKARAGGMDAAGPFIEAYGGDLSEYTEEQALQLCGAIWRGCADRLHQLLKDGEAPF